MCCYIAIIMGSIGGVIFSPTWISLIAGIIVTFIIFSSIEYCLNNTAVFSMTFIFILDMIYIIGTIICNLIMDIGGEMNLSIEEEIWFHRWFDIEGYITTDRLLLVAFVIAIIMGILLIKVIDKMIFIYMCSVVGIIQIFGLIFSYPESFQQVDRDVQIESWESIFIPMLNIEFYGFSLYLFIPILLIAVGCCLVQTKVVSKKIQKRN